jgi:2'-5' RNA ligase
MAKKKYAVIFHAKLADLDPAYFSLSRELRSRAMSEFGCLEFISLESKPGVETTISYWSSLEQIQAWRQDPQHQQAQALGKAKWYAFFETQIVDLLADESANVGLFFLALLPPQEIRDELRKWQHWTAKEFQVRAALGSPPHITIYPPVRWPLAALSAWKNSLNRFSRNHTQFSVTIHGFNHFGKEVVFADVEQSPPLMNFQKSFLKYWMESLGAKCPKHADSYHPHITLAFRNLTPASFKGIWDKFGPLPYTRQFKAEEMVLLKHQPTGWEIEERFALR